MAEEQNPVTHGELVEIVRRLDERISSMDRSMDDRFEVINERISSLDRNLNERISHIDRRIDERFEAVNERISAMDRNMTEMRSDIRMLARFVMGFYGAILAVVGVAFTLYKLFPNTP
ncbi:hypothetical protein C2W62_45395 [Candidatus Entotheonella serta]|nr:hypothetical protein C2W62_45395 [Candidatus Entotheonella serta]